MEFIFTIILMACLGIVLYLTAQALPRIEEVPSDEKGFLERWAHSEMPEKIDAVFNNFLAKFLRRTKVLILKLDNILAKHLQKIKPEEDRRPSIDFKEISGQNKEGSEE
ncbi:MAG TPA: hypothetical protein VIJ29_01205 [Candidatus Paceibacterota bacterium]